MDNYFALYAKYVKNTEPPANFHAWSAIAAVSALLGKKCCIPQGDFTVYPQLYIILVGEPGTRKSTAMGVAKRLVKRIPTVPIAPESATRESLIDEMSKHRVGIGKAVYWQSSAFVDELKEFIGGKHINQSMVSFLTAIWDGDIYKESTRQGGEKVIHNPYFTLLGCCNPSWITTSLKADVITEGFSRRAIFAMESEIGEPNDWPEKSAEQVEILPYLENECKRIHQIFGQFNLTKQARLLYRAKYIDGRRLMKEKSEKVQSFYSSRHILALKLAMCVSAGRNSDRIIKSCDIQMAFDYLAQAERTLEVVFAGVGRNELKGYADQVLAKVIQAGSKGLKRSKLMEFAYSNVKKQELDEIVEMLVITQRITIGNMEGQFASNAEPTYRAIGIETVPPVVDLLLGVSLLEEPDELPMEGTLPSLEQRHLAPETEQFLARQEDRRAMTGSGILLRGKPAQVLDENQKS